MLNSRKLDVESDRHRQSEIREEVPRPDPELEMRRKYLEERIGNCVRITDALKRLISQYPLPFA
jgi:hypothetical protein